MSVYRYGRTRGKPGNTAAVKVGCSVMSISQNQRELPAEGLVTGKIMVARYRCFSLTLVPPPIQIVPFKPITLRIFIITSESGTKACLPLSFYRYTCKLAKRKGKVAQRAIATCHSAKEELKVVCSTY